MRRAGVCVQDRESPPPRTRLIAGAKNLYHRTMLLTLYRASLRRAELCDPNVRNIDSQRLMPRVERARAAASRDSPQPDPLGGAPAGVFTFPAIVWSR